ncbi:hypothetical protein HanXRQr2_Chr12g0520911 [Helianthus annuus]|uniref:Uncharacterized protein n=1 Tax=Helianthus annuus TaxID=4232 RepID=A0A9K3EM49_HELAN|nr:hypothetical protein HanXRQr2_Chr12g0520911 [Helianthus annuus]KAJ0861032.1 hypothetical protein HanPSC8_Chr12g0502151 [Helianthus annuus]
MCLPGMAISSVLFNLWFLVYFTSDLVEQSIVQAFNQMCVFDVTWVIYSSRLIASSSLHKSLVYPWSYLYI